MEQWLIIFWVKYGQTKGYYIKKVKATFREGQTKLPNKDAFKLQILTM